MQIKKAVPYLVGVALVLGIGYQQKQISELRNDYASLVKQYESTKENYESDRAEAKNALSNTTVLINGMLENHNKLSEKVSHMRELDKETRRAVSILARDSKRSSIGPYPTDKDHDLSNW